jgi:hypothetical protein
MLNQRTARASGARSFALAATVAFGSKADQIRSLGVLLFVTDLNQRCTLALDLDQSCALGLAKSFFNSIDPEPTLAPLIRSPRPRWQAALAGADRQQEGLAR